VLFHAFAAGTDATRLIDLGTPRLPRYQHIEAGGRYDEGRQILIDNMVNDGRAGYFVITPFALTGGGWLLVNRGWVPLGASRAVRPPSRLRAIRDVCLEEPIICRVPAFRWVPGRSLRRRIPWSRPFRLVPSWLSSSANPLGKSHGSGAARPCRARRLCAQLGAARISTDGVTSAMRCNGSLWP